MKPRAKNSPGHRVCFFPANRNCWEEYLFIAKKIQAGNLAQPYMLAEFELEERGADFRQAEGLPLHVLAPLQEEAAPGAIERILCKVRGEEAGASFAVRRLGKRLDAREAAINEALEEIRPDTVVLSNGRTTLRDLPMIKACRERGVRTVALPLALPAYGAALTSRRRGRSYEGKHYPDLMSRHPGQYMFDQSKREPVSFFPAHAISELEARGMLPPNPWVVGADLCDSVLLAGENERSLLLDDGAEPERLLVTGLRAHDLLYELLDRKNELRIELAEKYGLSAAGKWMIAALPQSAEEGVLSWERHWQEIHFVCQALKDLAAPTLISLHPRMQREQYAFVEKKYGLPIAEERLADLLPAGDIFSSSFSSTVQWAVLCGIPSVIWPWFGVDYDVYDPFPGIRVVRRKDQLNAAYQQLLHDDDLFGRMALEQSRQADRLSPFDGRCMERIVEAICAELLSPSQER
jgi:hypothetical protein